MTVDDCIHCLLNGGTVSEPWSAFPSKELTAAMYTVQDMGYDIQRHQTLKTTPPLVRVSVVQLVKQESNGSTVSEQISA